jgi:hypothetical protein
MYLTSDRGGAGRPVLVYNVSTNVTDDPAAKQQPLSPDALLYSILCLCTMQCMRWITVQDTPPLPPSLTDRPAETNNSVEVCFF